MNSVALKCLQTPMQWLDYGGTGDVLLTETSGEGKTIVLHRHLTHQRFTLAAIDDVIARGKRQDWAELRKAALADRTLMQKILQVCQAHIADPYAQRYHFWKHYAERHLA